ncbi:MAG: Rho termination factor N-terminal domain-containing protein, partial [Cyanobacteriota bacterium]
MNPEAVSQKTLTSLAMMTLRQLRQIASDLGVSLYSRKSKEELVEEISTRQEETGLSLQAIEAEMAPAPRPAAETRVVFLPRDPQWAYVFWEISDTDRDQALAAGA